MTSHRLMRTGSGLAAVFLAGTLLAPPASAESVPFTDSAVQGSVGLCDASGHPLSAGSTLNHPYVTAVGSTLPAPPGYGAHDGGKATLYAFQPRRDVDPGQWSGYQLTGSSSYAEDAHPLAAGTNLDPSLQDFLSAYPAKWDGLVQLRIYYTAPNRVPYRRTYPAAVLRVRGKGWSVVQGAQLNCDLAKVVSSEKLLLPSSAFDPAHPAVTDAPALSAATPAGSGSVAAPGSPAASSHSSTRPAPTSPSRAVSPSPAKQTELSTVADARRAGSTSGSSPWLALAAAAIGVAGLAGAVGWRSRLRRTR
ncbi:MAG: hypothetical protein JO144_13200 [Actinobacteria bacterium]|nr:hypothetical protein [Actinomycetota bacterium]